jgi:hypothetical protein
LTWRCQGIGTSGHRGSALKGPTLDPNVKPIAVHVEDHPIEYLYFEEIIPRGGYGAGDVIVWATGTWEPHETDDPAAAVAAGELHADVHGGEDARPVHPGAARPQPRGREPVAAAAQARRVCSSRLEP